LFVEQETVGYKAIASRWSFAGCRRKSGVPLLALAYPLDAQRLLIEDLYVSLFYL
jgi:hypothetical protein